MSPIEAIQLLALEGGNVQAMQQFIGQGRWQDEAILRLELVTPDALQRVRQAEVAAA